jgi:hypothetical protein
MKISGNVLIPENHPSAMPQSARWQDAADRFEVLIPFGGRST